MPTIRPKKQADMTLDDVRNLIKEVRSEGLQIQSHYKRLELEYSDWEDRVNELEKIIYQAELDTGLTKEEIYKEPNEFADDILGGELSGINIDIENIDTFESINDYEPENDTSNILDNPQ
jgi:predicted nuclease with TOPRIM domain